MRKRFAASAIVLALVTLGQDARGQCQPISFQVNGEVPIPDSPQFGPGQGAVLTILVPPDPQGCNLIDDLNVDAIIQHTWQGNLIVDVTAPGGQTVSLMNRPGTTSPAGSGIFGFGYTTDNIGNPATGVPFVWDDEGTQVYDTGGVGAMNNPTGSFMPDGQSYLGGATSLSFLDGLNFVGTWTLRVRDGGAGNVGTLRQFSLSFSNIPEPGTLILVGLGAMTLLGRRRVRSEHQPRIHAAGSWR